MKIESLMTRNVYCVNRGQTLKEAARLMWAHDCGSVPVVDDDNRVVGMVTDRDIAMEAYRSGKSLDTIPVSTAASKQLVYCDAGADVRKVEQLMQAHQLHRVPITGDKGQPVGIISLNDIARAYKAGDQGIQAQEVSDTLASICSPMQKPDHPSSAITS